MLTIQQIKENPRYIIERLAVKGFDGSEDINNVMAFDDKRKSLQFEADNIAAGLKKKADSIGRLMKEGKREEAEEAKKDVAAGKERLRELNEALAAAEADIRSILLSIPNIPCEAVPEGKSAEDNVVEKEGGRMPELPADAMPHWDLAKKYNLINFDLGVKITGPGFPVYTGKGAKLQRALIQFFLDRASDAGYLEIQPPYVVNEASGYGTGQLPDKEGQMYYVGEDNFYLIPTAEVPVTNIYRGDILEGPQLPMKYCAYSACFRAEAGSAGRDTRGLIRQHQFNKVELVKFAHPDHSYDELESLTNDAERVLQALGLPYRVVCLCSGDLGFSSAKTYDIEVWMPSYGRYVEISSCSNFEDFQARRAAIRYKDSVQEKAQFVHTLNGSGVAIGRTVAAILENYQQADGSVVVPEALRSYVGADIIK